MLHLSSSTLGWSLARPHFFFSWIFWCVSSNANSLLATFDHKKTASAWITCFFFWYPQPQQRWDSSCRSRRQQHQLVVCSRPVSLRCPTENGSSLLLVRRAETLLHSKRSTFLVQSLSSMRHLSRYAAPHTWKSVPLRQTRTRSPGVWRYHLVSLRSSLHPNHPVASRIYERHILQQCAARGHCRRILQESHRRAAEMFLPYAIQQLSLQYPSGALRVAQHTAVENTYEWPSRGALHAVRQEPHSQDAAAAAPIVALWCQAGTWHPSQSTHSLGLAVLTCRGEILVRTDRSQELRSDFPLAGLNCQRWLLFVRRVSSRCAAQ